MPIFFRWYKHSVLASIVSIFGSAFIATGIVTIFSGGIFYGIGIGLGGALFIWLGSKIAARKAAKIAAKNAPAPAVPVAQVPTKAVPTPSGIKPSAAQQAAKTTPVASPSAAAASVPDNCSLDELLKIASKYASAGDTRKQIDVLKKASEDYPDNASVYNLLGIAYRSNKQYKNAFDSYRKALTLEPDNGVYHGNYAIALTMSGDDQAALDRFERALPLLKKQNNPEYPTILANYAYTLGKCGYGENALRCLDDAENAGYAHADQIRSNLAKLGIHK